MGRNALLPVLFICLIVFDGCSVCFGWELRRLLGDNSKDTNTNRTVDPRPPGPIIGENKSDPKPGGETGKKETNPSSNNSPEKGDPHATNNSTSVVPTAKIVNGTINSNAAGTPPVTKGNDENLNKSTEGKGDKQKSFEQENNKNNEGNGDQENKKNNEGRGDPETNPDPEKNKNIEGKGDPEKSQEQENKNNVGKGNGENSTEKENKNSELKMFTHSSTSESCDGLTLCRDQGKMVACIIESGPNDPIVMLNLESGWSRMLLGSKDLVVVVVQNGGDNTINVKLHMGSILGDLNVTNSKSQKVNISLTSGGSTTLTLTAGTGNCVLHMGTPVPKWKSYLHLPSFDRLLTPVNVAYFLILTVLVFGGTWACCKLKRKKHHNGGVQYQELEMALPESVSATDVETAEGWDQGWDDDWDEETAVKSPGRPHVGSVSANGLTSRSPNRDGWEDSWDD